MLSAKDFFDSSSSAESCWHSNMVKRLSFITSFIKYLWKSWLSVEEVKTFTFNTLKTFVRNSLDLIGLRLLGFELWSIKCNICKFSPRFFENIFSLFVLWNFNDSMRWINNVCSAENFVLITNVGAMNCEWDTFE